MPPVYPELAKQAHIQGTVRLAARIDETGTVERLKPISGHPFLVKVSFDAVKQWDYQPATYNGVPGAFQNWRTESGNHGPGL